MLHLPEGLDLPLPYILRESCLELVACRDDLHSPQDRQQLRSPARSAQLDPAVDGICNDVRWAGLERRLQQALRVLHDAVQKMTVRLVGFIAVVGSLVAVLP